MELGLEVLLVVQKTLKGPQVAALLHQAVVQKTLKGPQVANNPEEQNGDRIGDRRYLYVEH
jgi:hypothetical protein